MSLSLPRLRLPLALMGGALGLVVLPAAAQAELAYGVSFDDQLVSFDTATPQTVFSARFLSGFAATERTAGIDFRPATGELYVLSTGSRLYTANLATGALTQVGSGRFSTVLDGASFGVGFNPTVDRLRVVSDTRQNLRVNPNDASVLVDGTVRDGIENPQVTSVAYTNDRAGATTTTLFGLDVRTNSLVRFTDPNAGTFTVVGGLGGNFSGLNGFDISGSTGIAYASLQRVGDSVSGVYTIDLNTGLATSLGNIGSEGSNLQMRGLAIAPSAVPEPASLAILGVGLAAFLRRRRSQR